MVKCYTKKKKDGGNYTTCIGFQKGGKSKVKGVATVEKKIKTTRKLKNKSTIKPPLTKSKVKPKVKKVKKKVKKVKKKPKRLEGRKASAAEAVFGKAALGKKDSAVRKLVGSFRKGGKKGKMKNYVSAKQVKNYFKDKKNRRTFDDMFDETVFYPQEQAMNENDYYGELKVKISSGKGRDGRARMWSLKYGNIDALERQTGRDRGDLMSDMIDRQQYVAKKGSVAKVGRSFIKSLVEDAKNKKISFDFDETFQEFNMKDYIESELMRREDELGDEIQFKTEWAGF